MASSRPACPAARRTRHDGRARRTPPPWTRRLAVASRSRGGRAGPSATSSSGSRQRPAPRSTSGPRSSATRAGRRRPSAGRRSSPSAGPGGSSGRSSAASSASRIRCRPASSPSRSRRPSGPSVTTGRRCAERSSGSSRPSWTRTARTTGVRAAVLLTAAASPLASQIGRELVEAPLRGSAEDVGRPRGADPRRRDRPGRGHAHRLDSAPGEWRNGRRAGLRSRCRASGVSVRPDLAHH